MTGRTSPALLCLGLVGTGLAGPAWADRPKIQPFIDVEQYVDRQIEGTGDDVTYTELSGGLTAEFKTRRLVASADYRISQRFSESGTSQHGRSQDGIARAHLDLVQDLLSFDTGAIVTHSRLDPGGSAPQVDTAGATNLTQTYGIYAQPTLFRKVGEVDLSATYRYGFVINEGSNESRDPTTPTVDRFESSMSHEADASIGMKRSHLPFDWSVTNHYSFETTTNLERHHKSANVVAEVVVPLTATIAGVTSAGYESTQTSQREALLVDGIPVLTSKGRGVVDPASPRTLSYDVDGLIADGGIIWTPSHHTRLEVRAGYRYDGLTFSGSFEYAPDTRSGLNVIVFDRIDSFGEGLTDGLASTPASFDPSDNDTSSPYQNCLFGKRKGAGTCLGGSLGAASASTYRNRGVNILYNYRFRRTTFMFGGGYSRRNYIDEPGTVLSLAGVVDQQIFFQGNVTHQLSPKTGINFAFSGNLFKNGEPGQPDVKAFSLDGGYFRTFGRGLRAQATLGVESSKSDGETADISGRAQFGLRYQF